MLIQCAVSAYLVLVKATNCGEDCEFHNDWEPSLAICRTCDISESNLQIEWDTTTQIPFRMLVGSYVTFVTTAAPLSVSVMADEKDFESCSGGFSTLSTGSSGNASVYLPKPGVLYFASETECGNGVKVRGVVERKPEKYSWIIVLIVFSPFVLLFGLSLLFERWTLLLVEGVYLGILNTTADIFMLLKWQEYVENYVEYADVDWRLQFYVALALFLSSFIMNLFVGLCFIRCTSVSCWIFPCSIVTLWFVRLAYSKTFCYGDHIAPRDDEVVMAALVNAAIFYQVAPQLFFQLLFWHERGFLFNDAKYTENISTLGVITMVAGAGCLGILLLQYICPVVLERDDDVVEGEEEVCCEPRGHRHSTRTSKGPNSRKKPRRVQLATSQKSSLNARGKSPVQHISNSRKLDIGKERPSASPVQNKLPGGKKVNIRYVNRNRFPNSGKQIMTVRKDSRSASGISTKTSNVHQQTLRPNRVLTSQPPSAKVIHDTSLGPTTPFRRPNHVSIDGLSRHRVKDPPDPYLQAPTYKPTQFNIPPILPSTHLSPSNMELAEVRFRHASDPGYYLAVPINQRAKYGKSM